MHERIGSSHSARAFRASCLDRIGLGPEQTGQGQTQRTQAADTEELATAEAHPSPVHDQFASAGPFPNLAHASLPQTIVERQLFNILWRIDVIWRNFKSRYRMDQQAALADDLLKASFQSCSAA